MKHLKVLSAVLAISGLLVVALVAMPTASESCDKGAKVQQASVTGSSSGAAKGSCAAACASKTTAAAAGCADKATQASATGCAGKAIQASATGCAGKAMTMQAAAGCNPATCDPSSCAPSSCTKVMHGEACATTHVVYRVMVDAAPKGFFTRAEALTAANGSPVEYVAAGKAYPTEREAQMAMIASLHDRMGEYMTVAYVVAGEKMHCGEMAKSKAKADGAQVAYRVAAHEFSTQNDAEAYLTKIKAAAEQIKLADAQGKTIEGPAVEHAGAHPSCAGFVCGDKTITDPVEADLTVAQKRLQAIITLEA